MATMSGQEPASKPGCVPSHASLSGAWISRVWHVQGWGGGPGRKRGVALWRSAVALGFPLAPRRRMRKDYREGGAYDVGGAILTCGVLGVCAACRANTDPVLYYQTQDKWIREYWVHIEYMKMLKDEVRNCYRREGVNHYENCRDLVHEYYARTKAPMYSLKGSK